VPPGGRGGRQVSEGRWRGGGRDGWGRGTGGDGAQTPQGVCGHGGGSCASVCPGQLHPGRPSTVGWRQKDGGWGALLTPLPPEP
jgi:hypothetical protein